MAAFSSIRALHTSMAGVSRVSPVSFLKANPEMMGERWRTIEIDGDRGDRRGSRETDTGSVRVRAM
jgi:hypothetical protein